MQIRELIPSTSSRTIVVDGKSVNIDTIGITDSVLNEAKRMFNNKNDNEVFNRIKTMMVDGEYKGKCYALQRYGHLVVSNDIYIVIGNDLTRLVFITNIPERVQVINETEGVRLFTTPTGEVIDLTGLDLTDHFLKRSQERLGYDERKTKEFIQTFMRTSEYVGIVYSDEDKSPAHFFCRSGVIVIIDISYVRAITVYKADVKMHTTPTYMREKMCNYLKSELEKMFKEGEKLTKKLEGKRLKYNFDVSDLELKIYRAKKEETKDEYRTQLEKIIIDFKNLEDEWQFLMNQIKNHAEMFAGFLE